MQVADRNDAVRGEGCRRDEQGEDRRQPKKARPETPQMHPLLILCALEFVQLPVVVQALAY